jgi:hypothetical protein
MTKAPVSLIEIIESERNELLAFVRLVACGKRPDGTYNRCREALEIEAKKLIEKLDN